jgi:tRNA (guanine37-N1)-methyltransferase
MIFDIITIFPDFFTSPLEHGVIGKAIKRGKLSVNTVNLRDYTHDRHKTTDDRPFGGGAGMVMLPGPVFDALHDLKQSNPHPKVIFTTPRGKLLRQEIVNELAKEKRLIIICGRYEGLDERICEHCVDMEISIGDYVLSGGELPALVLIDAISRLIPGVLGCESSAENDSFSNGLLEYPHYTRPREFRGWKVPDILLSGDHALIAKWRRHQSVLTTARRRPDLLATSDLAEEEKKIVQQVREEQQ